MTNRFVYVTSHFVSHSVPRGECHPRLRHCATAGSVMGRHKQAARTASGGRDRQRGTTTARSRGRGVRTTTSRTLKRRGTRAVDSSRQPPTATDCWRRSATLGERRLALLALSPSVLRQCLNHRPSRRRLSAEESDRIDTGLARRRGRQAAAERRLRGGER